VMRVSCQLSDITGMTVSNIVLFTLYFSLSLPTAWPLPPGAYSPAGFRYSLGSSVII